MEYKTIFIYFVIIFVLVIVIYWFTPYLDALNPYLGNIKGYFLGCEWVTGSWGQCEEPCGKSNKKDLYYAKINMELILHIVT